jgi:uncharacterized protein YdhG (YjbR/CyaY superfamily)
MKAAPEDLASIDDYIAAFPVEVQDVLREVRATVRRAAPDAVETISYRMPTFTMGRVLVHFGAFKGHIGLFPPVRDPALQDKIARYRGEKGNLRFPLGEPMPYALIGEIVERRVEALRQKAAAKGRIGRDGLRGI